MFIEPSVHEPSLDKLSNEIGLESPQIKKPDQPTTRIRNVEKIVKGVQAIQKVEDLRLPKAGGVKEEDGGPQEPIATLRPLNLTMFDQSKSSDSEEEKKSIDETDKAFSQIKIDISKRTLRGKVK